MLEDDICFRVWVVEDEWGLLLILVNELEVANMLMLPVMAKVLMLSVMVKEMKVLGQFTTIAGRQHMLESLLALD